MYFTLAPNQPTRPAQERSLPRALLWAGGRPLLDSTDTPAGSAGFVPGFTWFTSGWGVSVTAQERRECWHPGGWASAELSTEPQPAAPTRGSGGSGRNPQEEG